ncbi:spermatogenesis-associated protein 46 [Discoglossus pictus]
MEIQEDRDQHETSLSSSSSSLPLSKQPWDQKPKTSPVSKDRISTQDILKACGTLEPTGSGYSCASCCRLYPSLHTLYRHIRNGRREGYSCKVFYRALKYFWERESEVGSMDNSYNEILMEENRGEHKHLEAE